MKTMRLKLISTILLPGALMLVACQPTSNDKVEEDLHLSEDLEGAKGNYLLPGLDHGLMQSPINILSEEATTGGHNITLNFTGEIDKVENLGHTVQLDLDPGNTISINERTFEFKQMHLHTPSEHLIDGITYPMEMHIVTTLKDQPEGETTEYLVLAFLVRMGKENKFISNFIDQIPKEEGGVNEVDLNALTDSETSNAANLLKELNSYYHYKGSLTTPPYTESVNWYVMKKIFEASPEQILRINSIEGDNARHVQAR
jgi:carbonic anhydrase